MHTISCALISWLRCAVPKAEAPEQYIAHKGVFLVLVQIGRTCLGISMVPMEGVEPTHSFEYQILSLARLPIPPHRLPADQVMRSQDNKYRSASASELTGFALSQ
jgi:hypothetical protein